MLLLAAWVFAALNTAVHIGAGNFDVWFFVNAALMLLIPVAGIMLADERG